MRRFALSLFVVLAPSLLAANPITLPFGPAEAQLGVYTDGDYLRGPRGLAWDGRAWLVADGYKGRVAWYDETGRFLKLLDLEAITPRTTGFCVTGDASMVTFNDQSITRWTAQGVKIGFVSLGLDLPEHVGADTVQAFAVFSEPGGSSALAWNRDFSEAHRYSLGGGNRTKAALPDGQNRYWLIDGADQSQVYHWKAALPPGSFLGGSTPEGGSLWVQKTGVGFRLWWVSARGELISQRVISDIGVDPVWGVTPLLEFVWGKSTTEGFIVDRVSYR